LEELLSKFASMSQTNFENIQSTVANQGAIIKSLETQIGQLSKLVTTHVSIDISGNTVDNPKNECKMLTEKELKRERDWEELMEFKRWFAALGMTLEEAYDMFIDELEEFHLSQTAGPTMPHKKTELFGRIEV
jgi:hypothetical protein